MYTPYDKKYKIDNSNIRINAHESSSVEGAFGHLTAFEHKEFCPQPYNQLYVRISPTQLFFFSWKLKILTRRIRETDNQFGLA